MGTKQIAVPHIGDFTDVAIIEVYIKEGDLIDVEDPLIALESAKAVTDIPSPFKGKITKVFIKEGDLVSEGSLLADIEVDQETLAEVKTEELPSPPISEAKKEEPKQAEIELPKEEIQQPVIYSGDIFHATPSVRKYSRELEVDLAQVTPSGPNGRILREDVQNFIKKALKQPLQSQTEFELEDFSKYGEIERQDLSRIQKLSATHLQRSWQLIPLVTQFDEADVTELETFRKSIKEELAKEGLRISILPFIVKAVVNALKAYPSINSSFDGASGQLILKYYYNIGIAVDTEEGLVVPVIKDADKLSIKELAQIMAELGEKARNKKLKSTDIEGASFSISSLGGIGGTHFTPLVNPPQVAILGVSKIGKKPLYLDGSFVARDILPFSLSYDHRAVDGALAVRFTTYLATLLSDIKRTLL